MRIAVITCEAYRDAWAPFMALFKKFWPDCPYPVELRSDRPGEAWCSVVARCANDAGKEPILMMQEDFFLTATVRQDLMNKALRIFEAFKPGCLRVYPMPGAPDVYEGLAVGNIHRGTPNRISCQAAIWKPSYLHDVAIHSMSTTGEAGDFENLGTPYADSLPDAVMSFTREALPWPIQYLASAISRGLWNPDAIRLCEKHGIALDRSMREVAD